MEANKRINFCTKASARKRDTLNEFYSNPSLIEKLADEDESRVKHFPFIVEWQMYNASSRQ